MSHRIMITAEVMDKADYEVIRANLADFPEVIDVDPIAAIRVKKQELSRTAKEIRWRLINANRFHNPDTGFKEWKPATPQHIKKLLDDIIDEDKKKELTRNQKEIRLRIINPNQFLSPKKLLDHIIQEDKQQ